MTHEQRKTEVKIKLEAKQLFAVVGYEGFSIRTLADKSGVGLSSIYHFFSDKDDILFHIFKELGTQLGVERRMLPKRRSASAMLKDRILFQFTHIEDVVFVLKYYLHFREDFEKLSSGYIPSKAYLHIEEVLHMGVASGEFSIPQSDVAKEAKVVAHAINGFLLEYYPAIPSKRELKEVTDSIHLFLIRSLTNEKEVATHS